MIPPTAEQKRLYQAIVREMAWASAQGVTRPRLDEEGLLVDWLRDTRAELMESEFKREHRIGFQGTCLSCQPFDLYHEGRDPRHIWGFERWRQAAEKLYREG